MKFLEPLVVPMTNFLNFLYHNTVALNIPSYALAIILFTITIKLILYPLNAKSMRSMKLMQELQPKIKEIQQKQKDPQKAQMQIMELYKQYGANPLSGCLPMLIQMPILFALYQTLRTFDIKKLENISHAKFLWIGSNLTDKLSQATLFTKDPIFILPVLAGLSTFFLQKMSSNSQDPTQKTMLYMMPIFFTYISTQMPSGLVLYWVVFNILGIAQQYIINKKPLSITVKEESGNNEGNRKNRKNS